MLRLQAQWRWYGDASPTPLRVATVLFRSHDAGRGAAQDRGWLARCPDLAVVQVDGDHRSMLSLPHRAVLCARFAEAMRRGDAQSPSADCAPVAVPLLIRAASEPDPLRASDARRQASGAQQVALLGSAGQS